jgi:hypothetical protein
MSQDDDDFDPFNDSNSSSQTDNTSTQLSRSSTQQSKTPIKQSNGNAPSNTAKPKTKTITPFTIRSERKRNIERKTIDLTLWDEDEFFKLNEDLSKAGSHICTKCGYSVKCTNETRAQYQTLSRHYQLKHSELYQNFLDKENGRLAKLQTSLETNSIDKKEIEMVSLLATEPVVYSGTSSNIEFTPLRKLEFTRKEKKLILEAWANALARDNLPQSLGESDGTRAFLNLIGIVDIAFDHRTVRAYQNLLRDGCLKLASERIIRGFSCLPMFSIYLDSWSRGPTQFIGAILTFVCPFQCALKQIALGLEEVQRSCTASEISRAGKELLKRVGLSSDDLASSVNDNASVAIAASKLIAGGFHVECVSHLSHLILTDELGKLEDPKRGIETSEIEKATEEVEGYVSIQSQTPKRKKKKHAHPEIRLLVRRCSAIASHFNRSCAGQRSLEDYQNKKFGKTKMPSVFSPTRWTGLYKCVVRQLELLEEYNISEYLQNYSPLHVSTAVLNLLKPKVEDQNNYKILASILNPLYIFTLKSEKADFSRGVAYFEAMKLYDELNKPCIKIVKEKGYVLDAEKKQLTLPVDAISQHFVEFRKSLSENVEQRLLKKMDDETIISIWMSPRTRRLIRARATTDCKSKMYGQTILQRLEEIEVKLTKECSKVANSHTQTSSSSSSSSSSSASSSQTMSIWDIEDDEAALKSIRQQSSEEPITIDDEVKKCKRQIDLRDEDDLPFWRRERSVFPNLYHLFLHNRSTRASTSRLESIFSSASILDPDERASLSNQQLDCILVLKLAELTMGDISALVEAMPDPGPKGS